MGISPGQRSRIARPTREEKERRKRETKLWCSIASLGEPTCRSSSRSGYRSVNRSRSRAPLEHVIGRSGTRTLVQGSRSKRGGGEVGARVTGDIPDRSSNRGRIDARGGTKRKMHARGLQWRRGSGEGRGWVMHANH